MSAIWTKDVMSTSAPSVLQGSPASFQLQDQSFDRAHRNEVAPHCPSRDQADESLTYRLNQFRLNGVGCDVRFIVGNEEEGFLAHKLVLGCSSSVFNAMFYGPMGTSKGRIHRAKRCGELSSTAFSPVKSEAQPVPSVCSNGIFNSSSFGSATSGGLAFALTPFVESKSHHTATEPDETEETVTEDVEEVELEDEEAEVEGPEAGEEEAKEVEEGDGAAALLTAGSFSPFLASFISSHHQSSASPPMKLPRKWCEEKGARGTTHGSKGEAGALNNCEQMPAEGGSKTWTKDSEEEEMHEGVEAIRIPDCTPNAFRIMIQYIYSGADFKAEAMITDDNVMQTLYAAKKYDIKSLISGCVRYLLDGLNASNAACLLAQARLFQEDTLLQRCFNVIDTETDTALQAESFAEIDHETLMEVLCRSQLDPSTELVVFYAAQRWAENECCRKAVPPTMENLRECLGPALLLIRFPLMNVQEFGQAASSALLSCEEISEVFLTLTVKPRPYCRYPSKFRSGSRSKHVVSRFNALSSKRCTRRENKICFTSDRDIYLQAIGVYGMAPNVKAHSIAYMDDKASCEWSCQAELMLASVVDPNTYGSSLSTLASTTMLLQGRMPDSTPCRASFDEPVHCKANSTYVVSIRFLSENGVQTYCGKDGQEAVTVELPYDEVVTFKFQSYRNSYGNDDGGKAEGQIPSLYFLVQHQ